MPYTATRLHGYKMGAKAAPHSHTTYCVPYNIQMPSPLAALRSLIHSTLDAAASGAPPSNPVLAAVVKSPAGASAVAVRRERCKGKQESSSGSS